MGAADGSGPEGWTDIDTYIAPGVQQWGLMFGYLVLFQSFFRASSSWGIFVGENKCLDQGTVLLHGREDEAGYPVCAPKGTLGATEPATMSRHPLSKVVSSSLVSPIPVG